MHEVFIVETTLQIGQIRSVRIQFLRMEDWKNDKFLRKIQQIFYLHRGDVIWQIQIHRQDMIEVPETETTIVTGHLWWSSFLKFGVFSVFSIICL